MKHAGSAALDQLEPLLTELRALEALKEKARGVFYRRSRAFLHFHEDPSGLHADLRLAGDDFDRFRVQDEAERTALLALVRKGLA
ncbi:MAG: hypothetical protein JWR84_3804 [Caulobacter sp.]|nr:hypothetical protein [Caulobacter sp.]